MRCFKKCLAALLAGALSFNSFAVNVLKANTEFQKGNYAVELPLYEVGAKLGKAHAQYQLGIMYLKGLGVEPNAASSLIYSSLAAEQRYHNAQSIIEQLRSPLSEMDRSLFENTIEEERVVHQSYQLQFLPVLIQKNFDDELQSSGGFDDLDGGESLDVAIVVNTPGFLVVENDVAGDGPVRYTRAIQKSGNTRRFLDAYKLFPLGQPELGDKPKDFVNRVNMAAAIDEQFYLNDNLPQLYKETQRILRAAKNKPSFETLYQYVMAMVIFPWVQNNENEAESLLKDFAEKGHPEAMYEYGLQLYIQQKEISEAVRWITNASKYGLSGAEYRLSKLLQISPWFVGDEKKALFRFEPAADKGDEGASLHVAKIKLTANDKSLVDVSGAIRNLKYIAIYQNRNPKYQYLLSIFYRLRPERDFKKSVELLEKAISMGKRTNWAHRVGRHC